ncbi:hypothetical protein [Neptunomonas japonica]|uniref:hypothetical protein n=1 Tax=Neptunomonas japonica TaxID=417574 RepID=UPI0012EBAE34|nr:hypothetical protein [Neptunomonas japonica]
MPCKRRKLAYRQSPSDVNALNALALVYQKQRGLAEAVRWYQKAFEIDGGNIPSLIYLAHRDAVAGNIQKAELHDELVGVGESYLVGNSSDLVARVMLAQWLAREKAQEAIAFLAVPDTRYLLDNNWQVANNLA